MEEGRYHELKSGGLKTQDAVPKIHLKGLMKIAYLERWLKRISGVQGAQLLKNYHSEVIDICRHKIEAMENFINEMLKSLSSITKTKEARTEIKTD